MCPEKRREDRNTGIRRRRAPSPLAALLGFSCAMLAVPAAADLLTIYSPPEGAPTDYELPYPIVAPERLQALEAAIHPARLIPAGSNQPGWYWLHGRVQEAGLADQPMHSWLAVDARSLEPTSKETVWSLIPVPLELSEVVGFTPELDSSFSLSVAFGDTDSANAPIGSLAWSESMDRRIDFDGRLGLSRIAENLDTQIGGKLTGYVVSALTSGEAVAQFSEEEIAQSAGDPFHWSRMPDARGSAAAILTSLARWERDFPPGDPDFAERAIGVLGWLCSLVRVEVRTTFDVDISPLETRRHAASGLAAQTLDSLLQELSAAADAFPSREEAAEADEIENFFQVVAEVAGDDPQLLSRVETAREELAWLRGQQVSNPLPQISSEPSDRAYWALRTLREEPACALLAGAEPSPFVGSFMTVLLSLASPAMSERGEVLPSYRLTDRRGLGFDEAIRRGFLAPPGEATEIQEAAIETIISLLRPQLDNTKLQHYGLRAEARRAMVRYQDAFCRDPGAKSGGTARAQRIVLFTLAKRQLPIGYPCMGQVVAGSSGSGTSIMDVNSDGRNASLLAQFLAMIALFGGEQPRFGEVADGKEFREDLAQLIDAVGKGRLNDGERNLLRLISYASGGAFTKDFGRGELRAAVDAVAEKLSGWIADLPPAQAEQRLFEESLRAIAALRAWHEERAE